MPSRRSCPAGPASSFELQSAFSASQSKPLPRPPKPKAFFAGLRCSRGFLAKGLGVLMFVMFGHRGRRLLLSAGLRSQIRLEFLVPEIELSLSGTLTRARASSSAVLFTQAEASR